MVRVVDCYHSDAVYLCTLDSFVHTASGDDESETVVAVQMRDYRGFLGDIDAWPGVDPAVADAIEVLRKPGKAVSVL